MSGVVNRFPPGWDEERVRDVIAYYDALTEDEAVAEDEAAFEDKSYTVMVIPTDLVPAVRALLSETPAPQPATADSQ
jgi:hypothetical protein